MSEVITLLGVPTDRNSSYLRGAAKAPVAVRALMHAGMSNLTAENGVTLEDPSVFRDAGDLPLREEPGDFERIATAAADVFAGGRAVFLGGDHSISWPLLEGLRRAGVPAPHLLHLDAHPDIYPDFQGNPTSHASPMARILENGLVRSLTQFGIRTMNDVQQAEVVRHGVTVVPAGAQSHGALPQGGTYVSIDLDVLDPAFAPGVSHHEPGGLTVREVLGIIAKIPGPIVGCDIVEFNPDRDESGRTAAVALKLIKELAARMIAERKR
jgi:arginase